jgi:hypothetical protein
MRLNVDIAPPYNRQRTGSVVADLLDDLLEKPQRETVGSDTSSRFDYQKNWAFCQMLRRHMDGADYLVAFEFHDDVVFLEPSPLRTQPNSFKLRHLNLQNRAN